MVCQVFTGSWGRNFVEGGEGKITPGKFILFETSYLSLQWLLKFLNNDDTGIATQVDL